MTGYARATGSVPGASFSCEIKSVNGRNLDIRLRLSPGIDALETDIRQLIGKMLSRGSVNCTVAIERDNGGGDLVINQQALQTVLTAIHSLKDLGLSPPSIDGVLGLSGVFERRDSRLPETAEESLATAILDGVSQALVDLVLARRQEGNQTSAYLLDRLAEIETHVARAREHPARSCGAILIRLRQQLTALTEDINVPPERLAQEALLLALRPISAKNLTASPPTSRASASLSKTVALLGGAWISSRRNSTAKPIHSAPSPMRWSSPSLVLT
jgi:uncharacterized protein (TIGR00255 family)